MVVSDKLQLILDNLPSKPGCYIMKDKSGDVIYVGKAISLRSRVRSYFHDSAQQTHKTRELVKNIEDIEWIVAGSELEALILEMNLIKQHRPYYNVRLKDDKRYPYIKIHWSEAYPKVTVTRRMVNDGSRYFGPYYSVWAVHKTLDVLRRIFPYLTCDRQITGQDTRACLYFDIKLCTGPCIGKASQEEYRQMIQDLCDFLNGRTDEITSRMQIEMEQASERMQFEKAAAIRDQLRAIEEIVKKQRVFDTEYIDSDVIAIARSDREACIQVFFIRGGKMIGREYFMMEGTEDSQDGDVLAEFIKQFYDQAASVPKEVLLPRDIEEAGIIRQWLNQRADQKVEIKIPHRGRRKDLIRMASENAADTLASLQAQWESDRHRQSQSLGELQEAVGMNIPPNRIECYDISNTQGTAIVGSMVVFEQGIPNKRLYRRFNIRNVVGSPDDYASMEEVLRRRFKRWQSAVEKDENPGEKPDPSFSRLPDLLIVDGGKGQLGRAVQVLEDFGLLGKFTVAGLAKQNEELFIHGKTNGLLLPRKSEALYLLQRIRDEAHRFAITAHRSRRSREGITSILDVIPGIGPAKRRALMAAFGSLEKIRSASIEELTSVRGINRELAEQIQSHLD